ncbi:Hint domain-containing protein [Aliiroseovarius subalbicans]|uniref:Hint domain-containing protein n=1 Tax=Aliiroseovarius subalbicans TaxID=2925840 RepID=UPI001F5716BB|nr:Hint domain-containing protein [Aliiroseovarius subalbicans]MCI2398045.1 Hint domain-containing protein [Aliiroseovarius subalbicans]
MSFQSLTSPLPVQNLTVYPADMFRVIHGVNEGDAICDASDLVMEDIYELSDAAHTGRLAVATKEETGEFIIGADSELGQSGARLFLDCLVTFMGPNGSHDEALVLVEVDPEGAIAEIYLHALTPLHARAGYTLVTIDTGAAREKLAESACVSFTEGTRITLADGRQMPIERLQVGDRVLTRDSGPQEIRWVGHQTVRATGAFAPIRIAAGALNNEHALTLSPNHRLFIYQRVDAVKAGRKEVLVKARLLVNGTTVVQSEGGFVDYYQLLFDKHEIIYAEGIASESQFIDTATRPALPEEVSRRLRADTKASHGARELREGDLRSSDTVDLLRRASAAL